jgi:hypothetical protein
LAIELSIAVLARDPRPAKVMLILAIESGSEDTNVRRVVQLAYRQLRDTYAQILRSGMDDGTIRANLDPDAQAAVMQGALRGIVLQYSLDPDIDLEAIKAAALASLRHDLTAKSD